MQLPRSALIILAAAAVSLGACAADSEAAPQGSATDSQNDEPSESRAADGSLAYEDVGDLRTDFTAAGGSCPAYTPDNAVTLASESANCSDTTVLMLFDDQGQKAEQMETLTQMGTDILVGQNWLINSPPETLREVQGDLGGEFVEGELPDVDFAPESPPATAEDSTEVLRDSPELQEMALDVAWGQSSSADQAALCDAFEGMGTAVASEWFLLEAGGSDSGFTSDVIGAYFENKCGL
ncbi:hypothetical protein [Georgenia sp. AZ-5]|uniref:hypothetical protein n=1 Tax=Georgenia sp. AZ-5 TaxID=3367526 RepID=UPI00375472BD